AGDILQLAGLFTKEMVVIGYVGVEIGPAGFYNDLMQQSRIGELMEGVVHGRERHPNSRAQRLAMQLLSRDVAVSALKEKARQSNALARGTQICRAQAPQS